MHIVISLSDLDLPPVKELKVTIPQGYPSIPPIIQNEQDNTEHQTSSTNDNSSSMQMAEYDEDEDFLKIQEAFFEERLDSLGPDLGFIKKYI